ncbi:hypothetical protein V8E36_005237, partial [Tilletia maclaganii]
NLCLTAVYDDQASSAEYQAVYTGTIGLGNMRVTLLSLSNDRFRVERLHSCSFCIHPGSLALKWQSLATHDSLPCSSLHCPHQSPGVRAHYASPCPLRPVRP